MKRIFLVALALLATNSFGAKQERQFRFELMPDGTGKSFGNVISYIEVGSSDDEDLVKTKRIVIALTAAQRTTMTNAFNTLKTLAKATESLP